MTNFNGIGCPGGYSVPRRGTPAKSGGKDMRDTRRSGLCSIETALHFTALMMLWAAAAFGLMTPLAFSQTITTADVVGVVSDSSGAVVPGAKITIKSAETGESRTETSNAEGQYR